jgi:hypothetical protein
MVFQSEKNHHSFLLFKKEEFRKNFVKIDTIQGFWGLLGYYCTTTVLSQRVSGVKLTYFMDNYKNSNGLSSEFN